MNLVKVVSDILGREVSEEEAMVFAKDQFGVLTTYLREKNKPKETRVYFANCVDIEYSDEINCQAIENWTHYEEIHKKLSPDAEKFILECEGFGGVCTLETFQNAINRNEINIDNSFFYITNNY